MINFLKKIFKRETPRKIEETAFTPSQLQLAISMILVRTAKIDDEFHILERNKIHELVLDYFKISNEEASELLLLAENEEKIAIDLYSYTNIIKKEIPLEERKNILKMMWQIIITDQNFDPYENNLVWRVAELIGINTRERVKIKKDFLKNTNE